MTCRIQGTFVSWEGSRDAEGHRTYHIAWLVEAAVTDGPANVMRCPGLPIPGVRWFFKSDIDNWAFCLPEMTVKRRGNKEGEPTFLWDVGQTFSTKPPQRQRCNDTQIEDPLLEPADISGGYNKYNEEATVDRFGLPILTSSWEPVRGPQVEFDANRGTIKIKQNTASFFLAVVLPYSFIDCVNDRPLWGFGPRTVKLSSAPWERKFFGQCSVYYTRTLEFDVDCNTFDKVILDEGTKALHGRWNTTTGEWELIDIDGAAPDPSNPAHFDQFQDKNGNVCRVILNGRGLPALSSAFVKPVNNQGNLIGLAPTYQRGDKVHWLTDEGENWVCLKTNNNVEPRVGSQFWMRLSGAVFDVPYERPYHAGDILRETGIGVFVPGAGINWNQSVEQIYVAKQLADTLRFDIDDWEYLGTMVPNGNALNDKGEWLGALGNSNLYDPIGSTGAYDGQPTEPGSIVVSKYGEGNFLLLGIPAILG